MTLVEGALVLLGAGSGVVILWLLAYLVWDTEHDRRSQVGGSQVGGSQVEGVTHMEALRWKGWTPVAGWPPETCWRGCKGFHRHDWWRAYQGRTCWDGCEDLHRDDWWRAYVDRVDSKSDRVDSKSDRVDSKSQT